MRRVAEAVGTNSRAQYLVIAALALIMAASIASFREESVLSRNVCTACRVVRSPAATV
jgi:hypothetical protein